jgi:hypothetical protein
MPRLPNGGGGIGGSMLAMIPFPEILAPSPWMMTM